MQQNQKSNFQTFVQLLRRGWIPVAVVTLAAVLLFAGQPVWAADGALQIGQTVPTPTPTLEPAAPTATPAPTTGAPEDATATPEEATATPEATPEGGAAPVEVTAEAATGAAEAPAAATFTSTLTGTVTALTLNVRQGPAITFPVIGRLTADAGVTVLARNLDGTWLLVCCIANGSNGWVSAQYVAPSFSTAEGAGLGVTDSVVTTSTVTSAVTGTVTAVTTPLSGNGTVNVLTLNIRQGPNTTPPVLGRFRQGDTVTILGTNAAGDWYQVCCIPGTQNPGWVSAQFVTVDTGATATPEVATPEVATPEAATPEVATPEATTPEAGAAEATPTPEATEETDDQTSQSNTSVTNVLW